MPKRCKFLIVFSLFFAVQHINAKESVTIAMSLTPLSAPIIIADEKGFFKAEGLDITIKSYRGGHRTIKAMFDGEADIATSSEAVVMFNSLKRNDFGMFATFVTSDNDVKIMACERSGIKRVEDLAGKRVATVVGAASHFFLSYTLLMNGIDQSSVEIIALHPEDTTKRCLKGDVDAIAIWEPYPFFMKKELGASVFEVPHPRDYIETFNAVTMKNFADKNTNTLISIVKALIRSTDYINKETVKSQQIVAERLKKDVSILKDNWSDYQFSIGLHQWLLTSLETEARWAIDNKLTEANKTPNYLNFMFTKPLKKVAPEAMTIIE